MLDNDLDGAQANETVPFGVVGSDYEIDLSTENATAFRPWLAPTSGMPIGLVEDSGAGRSGVPPSTRDVNIPVGPKIRASC